MTNPEDEIFEISSISADVLNAAIDTSISASFVAGLHSKGHHNGISDVTFNEALSLRGEISKLSVSLGTDLHINDDTSIFLSPQTSGIDDNIFHLETILDDKCVEEIAKQVSAMSADTSDRAKTHRLSKLWMISEDLAKGAIDHNTHLNRLNSDNNLSRHYSSNDRMLRYRRINSTFFSDTMFVHEKATSLRGYKCCQVFVSDKGYVAVYPMKRQEEFQTAFHWFCKQVGVPVELVVDAHKAQTSNITKRFCHQIGTTLRILERGTPWSNQAELYIGLLKEDSTRDLRTSNAPLVLWDYAIERRAMIHNLIPRPLFQNNGLTPHEVTFGSQGDISRLCNYGWYDWVYYRDHSTFPIPKLKVLHFLGPMINDGNEMAQAILTSQATVITRRTLRRLT